MQPIEAYNLVATSEALSSRLDRGQNATIELWGEEYGKKWLLKTTRPGENPELIKNEIEVIRELQDTGVVPELHEDYLDDSWGEAESYAMLMINNAASLGDYAEAAVAGIIPMNVLGDILKVAAASLEEFHQSGYIHNDLHANNLVITLAPKGQWKVYVIDFGWSYKEGELPDWMDYERSWVAEDNIDDITYLAEDLEGRSDDEEYLGIISKWLRY